MLRVEEREIEANGLRFETLVTGPSDGEAVILLHGYPQSGSSWSDTINWLGDHGYRALAPSLRGYSPGANPGDASAYAMDLLVADVIGIAHAQGIRRFHLVGHDWGGALAWMVASSHADRLLSLTVLSTPHPTAMRKAMGSSTQMLRSSYMGLFRIPRVPEVVLQAANFAQLGATLRLSGLPRESWSRDRAHLRRLGGMRGPLNWYRGAATSMAKPRKIDVPTMFIWGRHDFFLGRRAAELTGQYVSGEYRFVELDAGHWIIDRNPDQLRALLSEHLGAHRAPAATAPARPAAAGAEPAATNSAKSAATSDVAPSPKPAGKPPAKPVSGRAEKAAGQRSRGTPPNRAAPGRPAKRQPGPPEEPKSQPGT